MIANNKDIDLDEIPLTVIVKRSLHEIGPADRNQIAGHVGLHPDDLNRISKALGALDKRGEIERLPGTATPTKWQTKSKKNRPAQMSNKAPPTAKDAASKRLKKQPATTKQQPPAAAAQATPDNLDQDHGFAPVPITSIAPKPPNFAALAIIRSHLDELETQLQRRQPIRARQTKSALLERLSCMMSDDIAKLLLEINRDLLTADGSIPASDTNRAQQ